MQGAIAGHLARRGLHFAGNCIKHSQAQTNNGIVKIAAGHGKKNPLEAMQDRFRKPGSIVVLVLTALAFFMASAAVEYTIRFVATNLAVVEATEDTGSVALSSNEPDSTLNKTPLLDDVDSEEHMDQKLSPREAPLPTQPITRKLRTTFRHLSTIGGFRSRFRGLGFAIFYLVVTGILSAIFRGMFHFAGPVGFWLANTVSAILCCNVHATWTHATIAAPSEKRFFQRFLPRSEAKSLILPTLRLHMTIGMAHGATVASAALAVSQVSDPTVPRWLSGNLFFLPIAVAVLTGFFLVLPSYIALIRNEASLLPADMTAIVPFDRTFNGRLVSQEAETKRCAFFKHFTARGAYMLFGRETYKRVAKMQVKFLAVATAVSFAFMTILVAEVFVIAGGEENIREFIKYVHEHNMQF